MFRALLKVAHHDGVGIMQVACRGEEDLAARIAWFELIEQEYERMNR